MRRILTSLLFAAAAVVGTVNCQAPPLGCSGQRNNAPVLELEAKPLKSVPNGESWVMQQDTNVVYIARLQGTAYEMGYAYGQLYAQQIQENLDNLILYGKLKIEGFLSKLGLSQFIMDLIWNQV